MTKTSKAAKIVSFGYIGLLVVLIVTSLIYLAACPDFVKPGKESKPVQDTDLGDYSVYEYTVDDFYLYMEEKGVWTADDVASKVLLTTIGTVNYNINGIDFLWWDVENLTEGSEEYDYWNEFEENEKNDELRYIMFGGTIYAPQFNGPFAIYVIESKSTCEASVAYAALDAFPGEYSGKKNHLQDAQNYFVNNGILASSTEAFESEYVVGSANRNLGGIELVWWDLDTIQSEIETLTAKGDTLTDEEKTKLAEDNTLLANYNSIKDTGKVTVSEKELSYVMNGNFAIRLTEDYELPDGFDGTVDTVTSLFQSWDTGYVAAVTETPQA